MIKTLTCIEEISAHMFSLKWTRYCRSILQKTAQIELMQSAKFNSNVACNRFDLSQIIVALRSQCNNALQWRGAALRFSFVSYHYCIMRGRAPKRFKEASKIAMNQAFKLHRGALDALSRFYCVKFAARLECFTLCCFPAPLRSFVTLPLLLGPFRLNFLVRFTFFPLCYFYYTLFVLHCKKVMCTYVSTR